MNQGNSGRVRASQYSPEKVAECLKENLKRANDKSRKNTYLDNTLGNNFNGGSRR